MERPPRGRILYDGACGFCVGTMRRWSPALLRRGFLLEPGGAALTDIALELCNGRRLEGSAVYFYVARRIWWLAPAAWLFSLPGLRQIADSAYRYVASHRYCLR